MQAHHESDVTWTEAALERLQRAPEFVRGQVVEAIEGNAHRRQRAVVDEAVIDDTIGRWTASGDFHEGKFGFR